MANAAAWGSLGDIPAAAAAAASAPANAGDSLWSSFQGKQQEKSNQELERQQIEARMAADRERENEELRRRAREHEEAAARLKRQEEEVCVRRRAHDPRMAFGRVRVCVLRFDCSCCGHSRLQKNLCLAQEELERGRELQREREAARRAREEASTVDLGEQSMMMDMMDGSFG